MARTLHERPAACCCLTVLADGNVACLDERGEPNGYEIIAFGGVALARFASEE